jgi:predicted esterase YcpF (UPF0227 family)
MVTAQTSDCRLAKRAYKISTCCLLAILLYSCNPSSEPGELFPKPGSPKEDTTTTQKENSNVEQQNFIVSAPAPPADTNASLSTANAIAPSSHSERTGSHDVVVSSQGPDLGREIGQLESTNENNSEPPLAPQEILDTKLNNPYAALTPNQSISLIHHCAELGEHNAASATNKEVLMVLGNTGEGKSTTVNYWLGCEMKLVKPSELGLDGVKKVIVVDPDSMHPEVVPIAHGDAAHTFMPQIVPDPDHDHRAYCDCPGFSDNRGPEINIANAINTRRVLQQARGVKAVFLAEYPGLLVGRSNSIQNLESMCHQMFGGPDNLRRHQNSVLLGITKAPLYEDDELLTQQNGAVIIKKA